MVAGHRAARNAVVLGLLAVASIPAGVVLSWWSAGIGLIEALYGAVPAAFVLGALAFVASRRSRYARARSLRTDAQRLATAGLRLAYAGIYLGVTGGIALAFDAILRSRG